MSGFIFQWPAVLALALLVIPLGALLGSQVGCPVAQGQGPFGGLGF